MSDNRKDLPAPTSANWGSRVTEEMRRYLGRLGGFRDWGVTLGMLVDAGILKIVTGANGGIVSISPGTGVYTGGTGGGSGGGTVIVDPYEPDLTPPPQPTGFEVDSGLTNLFVSCDAQLYSVGHGHDRTNVYGLPVAAGAPLPTFGDAVLLFSFQGTVDSYAVNPATTYHLWMKWQTKDGVESIAPAGGANGLKVSTAQDPGLLLDLLSGSISESMLDAMLRSSIAQIPELAEIQLRDILSGWEQDQYNNGQIAIARRELYRRIVDGELLETQARLTLAASLRTADSQIRAGVLSEQTARVAANKALAEDITQLETTISNPTTGLSATAQALDTLRTTVENPDTGLAATAERATQLESEINDPATGVSATAGGLESLRTAVIHPQNGLAATAQRTSQLESTVNNPDVGVGATAGALQQLLTRANDTETGLEATAERNEVLEARVGKARAYTLIASGNGSAMIAQAGIYDLDNQRLAGSGPVWNTFGLDAQGNVVGLRGWNTYSGGEGPALANALAANPHGTFTGFFTIDEPNLNLGTFRAQLLDYGATGALLDQIPYRGAYILIGYKGAGEGGGIELLSPFGNSDNGESRNWQQYRLSVINGWPANLGGNRTGLVGARAAVATEAGGCLPRRACPSWCRPHP